MTAELLTECEVRVARDILGIKVMRFGGSFVCERVLIERDGTKSVQCLTFRKIDTLRKFMESDPLYRACQKEIDSVVGTVRKIING